MGGQVARLQNLYARSPPSIHTETEPLLAMVGIDQFTQRLLGPSCRAPQCAAHCFCSAETPLN
jgi:hypothetical protein